MAVIMFNGDDAGSSDTATQAPATSAVQTATTMPAAAAPQPRHRPCGCRGVQRRYDAGRHVEAMTWLTNAILILFAIWLLKKIFSS